jgi:hypothetical protein
VLLNNLGVLAFETAQEDLNRLNKALDRAQCAVEQMQVYCFWATRALVREDREVLELVREQVAAETAGALLPSAAPRGLHEAVARAYLVMLSNLLTMLKEQGQQQGGEEEEQQDKEGWLALRERGAGILRHSLAGDQEAIEANNGCSELEGMQVIGLVPDPASLFADAGLTSPPPPSPATVKVGTRKAARMRARLMRREQMLARKKARAKMPVGPESLGGVEGPSSTPEGAQRDG